jgi:hypothetical protein
MIQITPQAQGKPTLYREFDRIRERPGMWLGEASLTALWHFANAYQHALSQHGIDEKLDPPFAEFHDFCARYFQSTAVAGWRNIILADNFGQEEQSLRHFFSLFDQFRAREDILQGRRIVTAFAHELTFQQTQWRAALPDFDRLLAKCHPPLCDAYRAHIAHEYDAVLQDLEHLASDDAAIATILNTARTKAERRKKL